MLGKIVNVHSQCLETHDKVLQLMQIDLSYSRYIKFTHFQLSSIFIGGESSFYPRRFSLNSSNRTSPLLSPISSASPYHIFGYQEKVNDKPNIIIVSELSISKTACYIIFDG